MSKERRRAREAREAARAAERERAARERARQERLQRLRPSLPKPRRRPRRYGALPTRIRLVLAGGWLFVQFVAWQLLPDPRGRLGIALVSLIAVPLAVVVVPWPSSWKAR